VENTHKNYEFNITLFLYGVPNEQAPCNCGQ